MGKTYNKLARCISGSRRTIIMSIQYKKLFLLVGVLSPYSCSMSSERVINLAGQGASLVGRGVVGTYNLVGQGLSGARGFVSRRFYDEPFDAIITITYEQKNIHNIGNKPEDCFSISIALPGKKLGNDNDNALVKQFLKNDIFTYDSKERLEGSYDATLTGLTTIVNEQNRIRNAWSDIEKKLMIKYIKDLKKGPGNAFKAEGNVGGNSSISKFLTEIYNDMANFAWTIGISMPRVETQLHSLLTHNLTKGIAATALLAGLGYAAYKNREQIPSMEQLRATTLGEIGSGLSAGASAASGTLSSATRSAVSATATGVGTVFSRAGSAVRNKIFGPSTPVAPQEPGVPQQSPVVGEPSKIGFQLPTGAQLAREKRLADFEKANPPPPFEVYDSSSVTLPPSPGTSGLNLQGASSEVPTSQNLPATSPPPAQNPVVTPIEPAAPSRLRSWFTDLFES
jgi:hypothetical protein